MNAVDRHGVSALDRHGAVQRGAFSGLVLAEPVTPARSIFNPPYLARSIQMYSMHEALARERMQEQREQAAHSRLAHQLSAARRWDRLAAFSLRRAARSQRRLAESSDAEYQLVG